MASGAYSAAARQQSRRLEQAGARLRGALGTSALPLACS